LVVARDLRIAFVKASEVAMVSADTVRSMSGPPSDFARLLLFCELVDEYDDLASALPLTQGDFELIPFAFERAPDHWPRVVRAMALRKFVFTRSDHVYVPTVLDAVVRCLADATLSPNVETHRERFRALARTIQIDEGSGTPRTAPEIIEDLIYGGLLHGDFDRHERVKLRPFITHDVSLWFFVTDAEAMLRSTRSAIRDGIDKGLLLDPSDAKSE
jgi:hypothetical protein